MILPKLVPLGMRAGNGTYTSLDGRFVFASTVTRSVPDPKKKARVWTATGPSLAAVREGVEKYIVAVKTTGTSPAG